MQARASDGQLPNGGGLAALFEQHRERLLLIVRQRLGTRLRRRLDSGDILQSAVLDALQHWSVAGPPERDFLPWMAHAIELSIRERARFFGRTRRAMDRNASGGFTDSLAGPGTVDTPSVITARSEDIEALERALDRLSERDRRLVVLAKIEGRPLSEIADELGIAPEAAKRAITRAVAHLAAHLA